VNVGYRALYWLLNVVNCDRAQLMHNLCSKKQGFNAILAATAKGGSVPEMTFSSAELFQ